MARAVGAESRAGLRRGHLQRSEPHLLGLGPRSAHVGPGRTASGPAATHRTAPNPGATGVHRGAHGSGVGPPVARTVRSRNELNWLGHYLSDGEIGPSLDGFSILRPPRSLDELRALGLGKELFLRINPSILVDVEVTAGGLTCTDVPYLGKVRLTAGSAELSGVAEAADVLVQAGSASLKGSIASGRSRVRVESGQLTVELDGRSNVTVRGEAQRGKITWPDNQALDEFVLGNGSARLDIGVVMGWATVKAELR